MSAERPEPPEPLRSYDAVMSFGGAMNTHEVDQFPWLVRQKQAYRGLLEAGTPTLGVCLGSQLVAEAAGAPPRRASEPEIGWLPFELNADGLADPVIGVLGERPCAFQWHSYEVPLPPGAVELARNPLCLQAWRLGECVWGIQFHAEVTDADAQQWIRDYEVDPDAVRIGLDPEALAAETAERIAAWNERGRALCGAFLDAAAAAN